MSEIPDLLGSLLRAVEAAREARKAEEHRHIEWTCPRCSSDHYYDDALHCDDCGWRAEA